MNEEFFLSSVADCMFENSLNAFRFSFTLRIPLILLVGCDIWSIYKIAFLYVYKFSTILLICMFINDIIMYNIIILT